MNSKNMFEDFPIISQYTRADAIRDGVLFDVSETSEARELRFRFPIALTSAVWNQCVEVPEGVHCQDWHGRLWDVLFMMKGAIRSAKPGSSTIYFELHVRNDNKPGIPPLVRLKAHCGPGDDAEPVITIMFPDED